jgi:subtilisin family serine protease
MRKKTVSILTTMIVLVGLLATPAMSQEPGSSFTATALVPDSTHTVTANKDSILADSEAAYRTVDPKDLEVVSIIVTYDESFDESTLESSGGQIVHRYEKVARGVSMVVAGDKVSDVASLEGVAGVYLDQRHQTNTEASNDFIGSPTIWDDLGGQSSAGEGVVVGILDTGIWPEHPSFSDPDPGGKPYDAPPVIPGSNGFAGDPRPTCDFGNTGYNPDDVSFTCNNKLIGAYDFHDTYKLLVGLLPGEFDSARDANGHGTHTASTAAGNGGVEADIFDIPRGTVSGVAPRAHVIAYKVCGEEGCYNSDSMAAVEQAILDEVDVINFSIGGGNSPYTDIVSLAFLSAYENGVFVAASAGNSGPTPDTTGHREPWVTTVAASTTDRHFLTTIFLTADNGDTLELIGASVTEGIEISTPVIFSPVAQCDEEGLAAAGVVFDGEIVICDRGVFARVEKSYNVANVGAGGMILRNTEPQGLNTDNHFIPSVHIDADEGVALQAFMDSHTDVEATFTQGIASEVPGDIMASFSSRGGPGQTLGISKPDVTAPGVQILAGNSPLPATPISGRPGELFQSIQGTSMSSPHVAGAAALLADLHPDWTPGQIRSALMMTADATVVKEDGETPADPFDYGSGRIDLTKAGDPGLTISATKQDYVDHEADLYNANYPSLYVPVMPGATKVERTVHSELSKASVWSMWVDSPSDVNVLVPWKLYVPAGGERTFSIIIEAHDVPLGEVRHATLYIKYKSTTLRFPITIVRRQPVVTMDKVCDPATFAKGETTDCTITISNTSFDEANVKMLDVLPLQHRLVKGSVVGADEHRGWISYEGALYGAEPPDVTVVDGTGTTPAGGYLPLSAFGITPIDGVGDETIVNFGVPPYVYAGELHTSIGMVSNGYAVVDGGDASDVDFINQALPDPARPNNVLAPFWTDLNPAFGGELRAAFLGDGVSTWLVLDWEAVQNYGDSEANSFQIWISIDGVEDISFAYGPVSDGDGGFLTVGAENAYGNSGQNWYVDGTGTLVVEGSEVRVVSAPGAPGETHVVTYTAKGRRAGEWQNCAWLTGDIFFGVNTACFSGEVTKP